MQKFNAIGSRAAVRDGVREKLGLEESPVREGNSGRQSWEQYGNIEQAKRSENILNGSQYLPW
jgi:hypothetical protein